MATYHLTTKSIGRSSGRSATAAAAYRAAEKRKDARVARDFAKCAFVDLGMVADVCMHDAHKGNPPIFTLLHATCDSPCPLHQAFRHKKTASP